MRQLQSKLFVKNCIKLIAVETNLNQTQLATILNKSRLTMHRWASNKKPMDLILLEVLCSKLNLNYRNVLAKAQDDPMNLVSQVKMQPLETQQIT
jgi:hypothetical protein